MSGSQDPERVDAGGLAALTGGHYIFPVTSECSLPGYPAGRTEVKRRFSDFDALHRLMSANYRGYVIPPLPGKALCGMGG